MNRLDVVNKILEEKAVAIVRGYTPEECMKLAEALCAGGVDIMEVTFHQTDKTEQERTVSTIKELNKNLGNKMCFGAGTVTNVEMVNMAYEAGCRFIVSPDTNDDVIKETLRLGMVSVPGALTPTEIKHAYDLGADFIKVFPACTMGVGYFKNIHAPLAQVRLLAVGGVGAEDAVDYINAGVSGIGVASCLFTKEWIKNGEWGKITAAAEKLRKILG